MHTYTATHASMLSTFTLPPALAADNVHGCMLEGVMQFSPLNFNKTLL